MSHRRNILSQLFWQIYSLMGKIKYPLVAQSVEQLPFKEMVAGSIPAERTKIAQLVLSQEKAQVCFRAGIEAGLSRFYDSSLARRNKISNRGTVRVTKDILPRGQLKN